MPKKFTQERPAIGFSTEVFHIPIEAHSIGSQLPKATDGPSLQPGPTTFAHFSAISNGPVKLQDYLCSDHPVLRLHVTSFTNSTIVVLVWPHAVAGALGVKEIFSAWSKVLQDENDVPALLGTSKDILDGIGTNADSQSPYALGPSRIKGWGFAKFAFRYLWTTLWRPRVESRAMCLPRQFVSQLRLNSLKELAAVPKGVSTPFLSDGDVLTAWITRFVLQSRGGTRPALIFSPLDITSRLNICKTEGVYVQNLAGALYITADADVSLRQPLGELAHTIRQSIQQQATDSQIRAQLRIFRGLGHKKKAPLYGDPDSQPVGFTNWSKFDMFNAVDFSPAVSKTSSPINADTPLGKPVYMHCQPLSENRLRDCFIITGKDLNGNYWITAFLYPEDWNRLEDYMQQTWQRIR